jgi:pimeloyl-ACP methyl ester carboxylesterase
MPFVPVDGVRLHYNVAGSGQRFLVFVHAYPAHSGMWAPQRGVFEGERRVVMYDVRGLGKSDAPDDARAYSQDRSVADLLALLDYLGADKADICGLSMGGNIALNFAIAHPHRVASLVVSGTGSGSDEVATFVARTNDWALTAEREGIAAFADKVMLNGVFSEFSDRGPRERELLRAMIMDNSVVGVAHTAREVIAKRPTIPALAERLRKMPVRTMVIAGERDAAVALSTKVMAESIPGARLVTIPGTGHFNNLEEPHAVNALLREFFLQ